MIEQLIIIVLLAFLAVMAIALARLANLFAVVMLFAIFSLLSASAYLAMDAADVALAEAAVGAGISTVLMLSTLALCNCREERPAPRKQPLPLIVVLLAGLALVWGTLDLPGFGNPEAPAHEHVAPHYIEQSPQEIGIPNMVTAILASYRGFDTLGEVTVIFAAGLGVLLLLSKQQRRQAHTMTEQPVLRVVAKFLIPLIILFALYVQFHGEYSPGGGFQAGVIFGSALIFYGLVFGIEQGTRVLSFTFLRWLSCVGILLFSGVGVATVLFGGAFLDYNVLAADPVTGQHQGILLIELGVGLTVAAIMVSIFFAFAARGQGEPSDNGRLDDAHPRIVLSAIPISRAISSSERALVRRQGSHCVGPRASPSRDRSYPPGPLERSTITGPAGSD